ncbi:hypothetical protein M758_8G194200 [Ceratodon purpureus]|nr:hypothetical protein M758_8G194200 [Ceratodon purpureus]
MRQSRVRQSADEAIRRASRAVPGGTGGRGAGQADRHVGWERRWLAGQGRAGQGRAGQGRAMARWIDVGKSLREGQGHKRSQLGKGREGKGREEKRREGSYHRVKTSRA